MSKNVTKLSWNQVEGIFKSIFSLEPKEFSKVEMMFLAISIEKLLEFPLMIKIPDYQQQFSEIFEKDPVIELVVRTAIRELDKPNVNIETEVEIHDDTKDQKAEPGCGHA